jgi:hypothetical protein
MKLYELTQNYLNLLELLENPDVPKEVVEAALEEVEGSFDDKAENIVKLIKSIEADVKGYKEEETRLSTRRKTLENKVKGLKDYLEGSMIALDKKDIKGKIFTLAIKKNPPSIIIDDFNILPMEYKKIEEKEDKKKIKESIDNGIEVPGARIEQKESLRIR